MGRAPSYLGPPPCAPTNGRPGFSFWFSGRWRALAKGTAWAGLFSAIQRQLGTFPLLELRPPWRLAEAPGPPPRPDPRGFSCRSVERRAARRRGSAPGCEMAQMGAFVLAPQVDWRIPLLYCAVRKPPSAPGGCVGVHVQRTGRLGLMASNGRTRNDGVSDLHMTRHAGAANGDSTRHGRRRGARKSSRRSDARARVPSIRREMPPSAALQSSRRSRNRAVVRCGSGGGGRRRGRRGVGLGRAGLGGLGLGRGDIVHSLERRRLRPRVDERAVPDPARRRCFFWSV